MAEANASIMKKAAENIGASTDEVQNYANAYEELRKAEDKDKKAKGDVEEANQ
jgi:hypothetical protein